MNNAERILACIDGSSLSNTVCDYGAWVSGRLGAPLQLLHAIDHHPETAAMADWSGNIGLDSDVQLLEEMTRLDQQRNKMRLCQGRLLLQAAKSRTAPSSFGEPESVLRHGSLVESLIELEDSIRVLVVGVRGKAHQSQQDKIGAKLESIIRSLHKPILTVTGNFKPPQNVMIVYDGSKASDKAIDRVANSGLFWGLRCHLLGAGMEASAEKIQAATEKLAQANIELVAEAVQGKTDQALCAYQADHGIDLTVMGAFAHTRIHDLVMGSFTIKMLTHAQSPLLLVR